MTQLTTPPVAGTADANAVEMPLAPIDLNRLAGSWCAEPGMADSRGFSYGPTCPPALRGARHEAGVRRLIQILLDNALKFTPAEELSWSRPPGRGRIAACVRDSARHPRGALPRIFERFYSRAVHSENGGAGLASRSPKPLAKAHGSSIRVESSPGPDRAFALP